mgnify:CR=1 FL=1
MNTQALKIAYKIKTVPIQAIVKHLHACDSCFSPPLSTYVDIDAYGKKIYEKSVTFEAWNGKELIGLLAAYYNDKKTKTGFITNVSVLKEHQHTGIASRLIESVINFGKKESLTKLLLEINRSNTSAIHLYRKCGFKETEKNRHSFTMCLDLTLLKEKK